MIFLASASSAIRITIRAWMMVRPRGSAYRRV